ncbi:hypothetical protein Lesp01_07790 [Lentzea sp. NBRC 102530]|nr:hypothetical protein Lesp01_07790 [Lentzea sp. NBRC 102530]
MGAWSGSPAWKSRTSAGAGGHLQLRAWGRENFMSDSVRVAWIVGPAHVFDVYRWEKPKGWGAVSDEELIVEFALTRLDNPRLDLEEVAALVVRRVGPERMVEFAGQTLVHRDELRGAVFPAAVEHVLRVVLTLRGPRD